MEKFNQHYYDFIYGTIHIHNYADHLSDYLIDRYGKVKFLDVGCGCGILVKMLREKGCEAWGIEVSNYALQESCIPEFVERGDMRSIPFPDNFFNVVHSRTSIGYFPESDLQKVIAELKRVGEHQYHIIDCNCMVPAYDYEVIKPKEWWLENFPENRGLD